MLFSLCFAYFFFLFFRHSIATFMAMQKIFKISLHTEYCVIFFYNECNFFMFQHNGSYEPQPKNVNTIARNKQQQVIFFYSFSVALLFVSIVFTKIIV